MLDSRNEPIDSLANARATFPSAEVPCRLTPVIAKLRLTRFFAFAHKSLFCQSIYNSISKEGWGSVASSLNWVRGFEASALTAFLRTKREHFVLSVVRL